MYRWLVKRLVRVLVLQTIGGRPWLARWIFAKDAEFVFPGQHSFAADLHSRPPIEQWIRRFVALRPDYEITDVVVGGPPWNTRVALRFRDRIGSDYENEGMQYMKLRWGRVVHERIFLDTQKIDVWEQRHPEVRQSAGVR